MARRSLRCDRRQPRLLRHSPTRVGALTPDDLSRAHRHDNHLAYSALRLRDVPQAYGNRDADHGDRPKALWSSRVRTTAGAPARDQREELEQFGWWFTSGKCDDAWMLEQLVRSKRISTEGEQVLPTCSPSSRKTEPFNQC